MKVVHIESGLGNQMLSYAEYLVLKKNHPNDECFIETIIYEIPECNNVICQWNGYELDRIFGINEPNIKLLFDKDQWRRITNHVRESKFWLNGWDYPEAIVQALNMEGCNILNAKGHIDVLSTNKDFIKRSLDNRFGYFIKRIMRPLYQKSYIEKQSTRDRIFIMTKDNIFTGQYLGLSHKNSGIEFVENEIKETFRFPKLTDIKNIQLEDEVRSCDSIAIHARRGDAFAYNSYCYKYGYFKRAVNYIKHNVGNPKFYFFSDPGSVKWCQENLKIFGLDSCIDDIKFIDWNVGNNSYVDMQIMSQCKHNIITFSSFGWWACYLNQNLDKITISPNIWQNTTVTL